MKHNYLLLLLCSFAISFSHAQIVNIPDSVFKSYLTGGYPGGLYMPIDTNGDGEIQVSEAEATIDLGEIYTYPDVINDMTGLESFVNVQGFELASYQGNTLDVSQNTALTHLYISRGQLTSIDLSQNFNLQYLGIYNNQLETIDLSMLSNLVTVDLEHNQLTDIIFPDGVVLNELRINDNQLTGALDLTNLGYISGDYCVDFSNNKLTNIILNDWQLSGYVYCEENLFTSLDFSKSDILWLSVSNNYHLQHLKIETDRENTGGDALDYLYANECPNLQVICNSREIPPIDAYEVNQSPNVVFTTDCSTTSDDLNQIFGTIIFDDENDGCDASDPKMDGVLVQTTDGTNTFSTNTYSNGFYTESVNEGTFTVSLPNLPSYFNLTPATQSTTFTGLNNTETLDFCVTSTQAINDVNVTLIPISQARPGFNASYQLVYKNVGTTTLSGDLTLQFDETMQTFVSANPIADASTINTLTFNYTNLQPFESRAIDIVLNTFPPPTVNGNDVLNFTATVAPDSGDNTSNDNVYALAQTVVNSYDPNDKQVLQGAEITNEQTSDYLDYLIRFQNTGTASAINISVTDVLNDKLDWNTLQMVSTSHSYEVNITNGNFVQFVFDGINLPAEQDNEPASHGFIAFKIKPKLDVVIGDIITGQANIYFDYNAPIITNEVSTEVVNEALSIYEQQIDTSIALYPNPINNQFNIEVSNGVAINSVEVFDISGKQLLNFKASVSYNINQLTSGVYFVKVKTNQGVINKQIVKK